MLIRFWNQEPGMMILKSNQSLLEISHEIAWVKALEIENAIFEGRNLSR